MNTSKIFSMRFWADTQNAQNNQALIYLRLTVNQKGLSLSLKRRASIDLWVAKSQQLRGNSNEAKQINQYLEEVRTQLFQIYQDLKYNDELITAQKIKSLYCGDNQTSRTLSELIRYLSKKIV